MLTQTIRREFLEYFKKYQHTIIPSSPVIPHDDPTLLFINAGMNQFKDVFLGKSHRDYTRAASSQKCIRVGGKHNDLENVGHTTRHLTFFEMLGNFSFGDYFKPHAIKFAWEVSTTIFGFEPERIWPTVFHEDDEAFAIWTEYVPAERITRLGEKDNFWSMGDTGPCGPCSELLYDRGPQFGSAQKPSEDPDGERFLEFWNLVFMQYNRSESGQRDLLPKPSIDAGAGLERIVSLKMGVDTVFETDVLRSIIAEIESVSGVAYHLHDDRSAAFRVIADHLRCLSFAIADGVQPSNTDRGYVLRKVLRRAVRYGRTLGMEEPFLAKVFPQLIQTMGEDYPELIKSQERITEILTVEEESFIRTLKRGGNILNQVIDQAQATTRVITGEDAFKLKDTYGLPIEEVLLIAKDSQLEVDQERYQILEEEAKQRSRASQKNVSQMAEENVFAEFIKQKGDSEFVGYTELNGVGTVTGLFVNGQFVNQLGEGEEGLVFLSRTPFYAEMGGQVGDTGQIHFANSLFTVTDTVSPYKGLTSHKGKMTTGVLSVGDVAEAKVNGPRRQKVINNHTATHLLHWALHKVLGEHIKQAGSVVDPERLRFDFSHHKALSLQEIHQIEDLVNDKIREDLPVETYELPYAEAQTKQDIKQFFGEKYDSVVRVVDIDYSKELCGGTHTSRTGTIGLFRIAKEGSIAAGIRRIEAVTGQAAEQLCRQSEDQLSEAAQMLKAQPLQLKERLQRLLEENKQLLLDIKSAKKLQMTQLVDQLLPQHETVGKFPLLTADLKLSVEELRECADKIMEKWRSGVIVLTTATAEKFHVFVKVSEDLVKAGISASDIVKGLASIIEGNGGGKANMAQAAGKALHKGQELIDSVKEYLVKLS